VNAAWRPAAGELDAATAHTASVIANPDANPADIQRAAELEEMAYSQIEPGPCDRLSDPPVTKSQIDWSPELAAEAEPQAAI